MTRVLAVDPLRLSTAAMEEAAETLRAGGLVAFPTETVYGLGANALDPAAVLRIFEAKGRPSYNPLIAHLADEGEAKELAADWPDSARRLARAFWPGPLTLVLPKRRHVPDVVTAGLGTVALRVPAHPVALALLRAAALPLAAPSANRFTQLSPTTADHVARGLGGRVDLVLDAGPTRVGIESTVVDLSGERPALLRPGVISRPELERVLGGPLSAVEIAGTAPRPSPGMTERHYSPLAELRLYGKTDRQRMERDAVDAASAGRTVGALLLRPLRVRVDHPIEMPREAAGYARVLYSTLHAMDEAGCDLILADAVPDDEAWEGVRDRMRRAAHR